MGATSATASVVTRVLGSILVALLVGGVSRPVDAAGGGARPLQQRGRRLLSRGAEHSTTFRRMLAEITNSNVVVYVDLDPYRDLNLNGVLRFVGAGGGLRYVIVWLNPRRTDDELIATLAHELCHATEVAKTRSITDQASFARLYQEIGSSDNPGRFETGAARQTAAQVAAELRQSQ